MVRTRTHEAAVVGLLAALATFCALEARGGQPSTVVGQSTTKTASTGKRPLAERIKAANRPIRLTAEAELAPDEGLIRDLSTADETPKRDWPVVTPTFDLAETEGVHEDADGQHPAAEPAAVPPPDADAVAANPTTADDAGLVGEVAGIDATGEAEVVEEHTAASVEAPSEPSVAAPRQVPPVRQAPPRRTAARVTPQRRDALLGRLRTALAEMPRPFGLLPANEPRPAPRTAHRQPSRQPAPIAVAKAPPTLEPAPGDPVAASEGVTESEREDADSAEVIADDAGPDEAAVADATPPLATPIDESATDDVVGDAAAEVAADGTPSADPTSAEEADSIAGMTTDADDASSPSAVAATEPQAEPVAASPSAPGAAPRPTARTNHSRTRAPNSIVHRPRPFERLQAAFDAMPRPLGILPAPRPEMHAATGPRRGTAAPQRAVARSTGRAATAAPGSIAAETASEGQSSTSADAAAPDALDGTAEATAEEGLAAAGTDRTESYGTDGADALASTEPAATAGAGEPALLSADESAADDTPAEAVACIEVTVEGPDGAIERGSDVTLHLTVRNTGTVAARTVTPVFHFGKEIEPKAIAGRDGTLTEQGTVVVEALAELAPGESIDVEVVATCHQVGTARFQGVVWCGEGDSAEQVPVDGELRVVPARIATAPEGRTRR